MPRDLLTEMAISEVSRQCEFAEIAYSNIERKAGLNTKAVFSSIHSFLSHCANVSKCLWSPTIAGSIGKTLTEVLDIPDTYAVRQRKFRNILEHYDEELVKWVSKRRPGIILDNCIGPRGVVGSADGAPVNALYVRHYDPASDTFTLLDEDLDLGALREEVRVIKEKADGWIVNARFNRET